MVFDTVVRRCIKQGLIKGEGFAIDASIIRADASRQNYKKTPIDWASEKVQNRAVKEYLESLDLDPALTKADRNTSLADLMFQWSAIKGPAQFYYSTNYMIDVTTLCLLKRRINMFARQVNDLAPLERQHQIMGLFIALEILSVLSIHRSNSVAPIHPTEK